MNPGSNIKKKIKQFKRKIFFRFFKDRIVVLRINQTISNVDLAQSKGEIENYVKKEMALKIGEKLLEDNLLEIESYDDPEIKGRILKAKLYCIKSK